jgi:hypothetical protein
MTAKKIPWWRKNYESPKKSEIQDNFVELADHFRSQGETHDFDEQLKKNIEWYFKYNSTLYKNAGFSLDKSYAIFPQILWFSPIFSSSWGLFAKNTGFEDSQMSLAAKAARDICLSSQPVFFANNPH